MPENVKRLYRTTDDKILCGIFGGLGEYLKADATLLRLTYVVITAFTGFVAGIVAYVIASLIIPVKPR